MIPVLYPATERTFSNNGLGGLPNAISCTVTEQRNTVGGYFLNMEYPADGLHFSDIIQERIIYASPAPNKKPQPFRIAAISKPINGIVTIEAPHVSCEMQKIVTYGRHTARTFTGITYDFAQTARALGQDFPFWFSSDLTFDAEKVVDFSAPIDFMSVLLGAEGSILDKYGGEYEFDKWNVILHSQRGVDTGLEIRYGVNMSDIKSETDSGELVTAVVPYWVGSINDVETVVVGDLCVSDNASAFAYVRAIPLDVSSDIETEMDTAPTKEQVTSVGRSFMDKTELKNLVMSTEVKYMPLDGIIGDRPINLCDTVTVVHPDIGVKSTAKVVQTKYNVLTERYDELTIGSIKRSIVDTIAKIVKKG